MPDRAGRAVVIGVGNALRGDDAAGLLAARAVAAAGLPGVAVVESDGDPATLMETWADAEVAVVLDALAPGAEPAGAVRRFDAGAAPLPARLGGGSTHVLGVGEAVELARALGRLPPRLLVFGIPTVAAGPPGARPSEAAARSAQKAAASVAAELSASGPG